MLGVTYGKIQSIRTICLTLFSSNHVDVFDFESLPLSLLQIAYTYRADSATFLMPFLALSFMIYLIGFVGIVLGFKNFFLTMLATEMMYSGVIFAFFLVGTAGYSEFSTCGLLLLVIAASESAIGLSILIVLYRFGHSIKISDYQELRSNFVKPQKFTSFLLFSISAQTFLFSSHMQAYAPLLVGIIIAFMLCSLLISISYLLSLATIYDTEKLSEYECGFAPFDSATRLPFDIHFYLVGILFLVFDVEISLILP